MQDLLNRLISRNWSDYVQVSSTVPVEEDTTPVGGPIPRGMSDEEELRRIGQMVGSGEEYYPTTGGGELVLDEFDRGILGVQDGE